MDYHGYLAVAPFFRRCQQSHALDLAGEYKLVGWLLVPNTGTGICPKRHMLPIAGVPCAYIGRDKLRIH